MPKARRTKKTKAPSRKKAVYTHPMHHVNWQFIAIVSMVVVTLLFIILISYMGTIRTAVSAGNINL